MYQLTRALWFSAFLGLGANTVVADIATVNISGLDGELHDNARTFLTIVRKTEKKDDSILARLKAGGDEKARLQSRPASASEIARWHRDAEEEIEQSLQPFGHYNPTIESELQQVAPGEWSARYRVAAGKRSRWRNVVVDLSGEGEADPIVKSLLKTATLRGSDLVDHRVYDRYKRTWIVRLYDAGYLDARFVEAALRVDSEANACDIAWTIDTGPRYQFGGIDIDQDILNPALVDKYHNIISGEAFDTRRLIDLQLKLNNSNYFESVSLEIQKDRALNARVPVVVRTVPRKRRRYDLGAGFGTDTGPRASAGIHSRRVNKRGHRYRVNARTSKVESALQFEYIIPIKDVSKDRWRLYSQVEKANVGDADAVQYSLGAGREDTWYGVRRRLFLNAERSNFSFGDEPSRTETLVYPGVTLSFDRLDDPQFVRRGFSLAATLQGGADDVGSSTNFVSLQLSGRGILPLGKRGRLLAASDAKIVEARDFDRLPPSQRFYLGGDRSVRGYAFQSISPENAAGDDIGGARSLNFSLEADYQVAGNWGVAAFFDGGDVSNGTPTDFRKGAGLGLRYQSPVGMIRVDAAHPFDDADTNVRFHLSIGPDL